MQDLDKEMGQTQQHPKLFDSLAILDMTKTFVFVCVFPKENESIL